MLSPHPSLPARPPPRAPASSGDLEAEAGVGRGADRRGGAASEPGKGLRAGPGGALPAWPGAGSGRLMI